VVALAAVSCSGPGLPGVDPVAATTTTVTIDMPAAPVDPWALPSTHQVPAPSGPRGPLQSLTESPGCDGPQGIRGPYAVGEGRLFDSETVSGPWGDYFGRNLAEVRGHLVAMELPNGDARPVRVFVHERAVPALDQVIANLLREEEAGNVYHIDPATTSSFFPATIPPKRYMSFHAMGIAIDVNSASNPFRDDNTLITDMPAWFVAAWTEAGWCWGGAWQDIKDPMHFSWRGPRYTPGYPALAPMPVRTDPAPFGRAVTVATALAGSDQPTTTLVADVDRDGAPDLVAVQTQTGTGRLELLAALAVHRFDSCWAMGPTPYPAPPGATLVLADADGDARPDLWVIGPDGETVSIVAYTHATGYTAHLPVVETAIPTSPGIVFLADDLDRDGFVDLWVVDPGAARAEVWAGPEFTVPLAGTSLPAGADRLSRFATGDREGDGVPDLFVLGSDGLTVLGGAGGLFPTEAVTTPASASLGTLHAGDFDGDGRADLYLLAANGSVSVFLGGDRDGVADDALMSWFLEKDDQEWEYRQGCPFDPRAPR